jgi:hypothetical protein
MAEYFRAVSRESVGTFEQRASELAVVAAEAGDYDFDARALRGVVGSGSGRQCQQEYKCD